ncbi:type I restriction-modification system subunit M [bacterium]|nr:type I restriction-modification system subunit M [bacterium]
MTSPRTKEQERAELHRAIWQIANDLRGSVDGWDFKQYVLGMLFYRFISENLTNYINADERRAGNKEFDYASLTDKQAEFGRVDTVKEKGFYILPSELFVNVRKNARNNQNLNEVLSKVFNNIENSAKGASSEDDLKGLFDDLDVNSNKLGGSVEKRNQQLTKLLDAIGDLKLGEYTDNTIDAFGDTYEYLMAMYASNAGKSGGEYYTPQEVSELLAEITTVGKKEVNKVYDPACGSGSLLLKFAKVLGKENVRQGFYGQEINLTTYNLCRINMFLHDINYNNFNIAHGDTLIDPKHWDDEPFDAIVSNPPYSIKWDGDANPLLINDPRFSPAGVLAPKSKADLAFTMHILSWLSTSGTAAIVEFPGVLYRGGAEQKIRKYLIDNNYIDAVIQLPPDLFFGTTIGTCIIVLKKSKTDNKTLFIDASVEFVRGGNKNKLTEANRTKILDAYTSRTDQEYFTKLVDNKAITENDYNIAVSSYVASVDKREVINISELNERISQITVKRNELRSTLDTIISTIDGVNKNHISEIDQLIHENCPKGVPYMRLKEITLSIRTGLNPRSNFRLNNTNATNYYVTVKEITSGKIRFSSKTDRIDDDAKNIIQSRSRLAVNDVLFSGIGTIGKVALVDIPTDNWNCSESVFLIKPRTEVVLPKFLMYILSSDIVKKQYQSQSVGSTLKGVRMVTLYSIKIPIPPLYVQDKIVNILDSFTGLEAELEAELEASKKQHDYYRNKLLTFKEYAE